MAEKEYIEREAAKEYLAWSYAYSAAKLLDKVPAADVVEVVRCGQCRHFHEYPYKGTNDPSGWGKCKQINMDINLTINDFCSYGERKCDNA